MEKLFNLYKIVLLAHIKSKTTDSQFHEKTAEFYDLLFEVFHSISEKRQDLKEDSSGKTAELAIEVYNSLEEAKSILEKIIRSNDGIGMDNLLRGHVDKIESACGNARAFLVNEVEMEKDEMEDGYESKKSSGKIPNFKLK